MSQAHRSLWQRLRGRAPAHLGAAATLLATMALFAFLVVSMLRAASDLRENQGEIARVRGEIAQAEREPVPRADDLAAQVAAAHEETLRLAQALPAREEVEAELVRCFVYAAECGVELTRLDALAAEPEGAEGALYRVERFALAAEGAPSDLLRLLERVASGPLPTLLLHDVSLTTDGPGRLEAALTIYASGLDLGEPADAAGGAEPSPPGDAPTRAIVSALRRVLREALVAKDWPLAEATGESLLQLAPGQEDVLQALHWVHVAQERAGGE